MIFQLPPPPPAYVVQAPIEMIHNFYKIEQTHTADDEQLIHFINFFIQTAIDLKKRLHELEIAELESIYTVQKLSEIKLFIEKWQSKPSNSVIITFLLLCQHLVAVLEETQQLLMFNYNADYQAFWSNQMENDKSEWSNINTVENLFD